MYPKNGNRRLEDAIAAKVVSAVPTRPCVKWLLSTERFSVDGALIEAWGAPKSVKPKDDSRREAAFDVKDETRSNETCALMESRSGLIAYAALTPAFSD